MLYCRDHFSPSLPYPNLDLEVVRRHGPARSYQHDRYALCNVPQVGLGHFRRQHRTYMISVQINGTLVLPFVLDTGASSVVLPADVFRTLTRTGTVTRSDFIGTGTAVLAGGSKHTSDNYVLHEIRVGHHIVRNVVASVVSVNGDPLLGQTFLSKLPSWTIDNARQELVFADEVGATQSSPIAPTASWAVGHYGAIAWDQDTGKRGWSWSRDSSTRADEVALSECGSSGCKVVLRTGPAMCGALATTEAGKYAGAASRRDRDAARLAALANCQKGNAGNCIIRVADCNDTVLGQAWHNAPAPFCTRPRQPTTPPSSRLRRPSSACARSSRGSSFGGSKPKT